MSYPANAFPGNPFALLPTRSPFVYGAPFAPSSVATRLEGLGSSAQRLGTGRMMQLLHELGDPQNQVPVVHVAGTNGKGSVSAMLTSILLAQGLRVGTYTSPHLCRMEERIQLNGAPVDADLLQDTVNELFSLCDNLFGPLNPQWPTYFEMLTLSAFQLFVQERCDIAVVEVGLGGRLDATNVVDNPLVSVITSIGMDHMEHLGDTLEAIAQEKAGILKPGCPVVLGPNLHEEARQAILTVAEQQGAQPVVETSSLMLHGVSSSLVQQNQRIRNLVSGEVYNLGLLGHYQRYNLATVLATVEVLRRQRIVIDQRAVQNGLQDVRWPGRLQVVAPYRLVVDGSHNVDGLSALQPALEEAFEGIGLYWLVSLRSNRDLALLGEMFLQAPVPCFGVVVTRPTHQAHLFHAPQQVRHWLRNHVPLLADRPVWATECPRDGLWMLAQLVQSQQKHHGADCTAWGLITGSLYTAGEVLALLDGVPMNTCGLVDDTVAGF